MLAVGFKVVPQEIVEFIRISAIGGFIATAALVININFLFFSKIFRERARRFWWLFLAIMIIPLLLILYIFTLFFGK